MLSCVKHCIGAAVGTISLAITFSSHGTWSIVIVDSETKEVAVGTVTCLTSFDLLALVPVVVVGKGGAAVQAAGDFDGIRRPIIFDNLLLETAPDEILVLLAQIAGHQSRQYGIVDSQDQKITFTGNQASQWAGGVVGTSGSMSYAIQGNILAGSCVVPAIEQAVLETEGDIAAKLMAGMQAARQAGGDGRCSCSPNNPTGCGCPPANFTKSGHIGTMVVARIADIDDEVCNAGGCADGLYFMKFNVPFQSAGNTDPVIQLQGMFDHWRSLLVGRPDAIQSIVTFDPDPIPPNGVAETTMMISLIDWQGKPIDTEIDTFTVIHSEESAGLSTIGKITDNGDGTFSVAITAGQRPGIDRFRIEIEDIDAVRPIALMPDPSLEYFKIGDLNGDGVVNTSDLLILFSNWGPCFDCEDCPADLDVNCTVNTSDLLLLFASWG